MRLIPTADLVAGDYISRQGQLYKLTEDPIPGPKPRDLYDGMSETSTDPFITAALNPQGRRTYLELKRYERFREIKESDVRTRKLMVVHAHGAVLRFFDEESLEMDWTSAIDEAIAVERPNMHEGMVVSPTGEEVRGWIGLGFVTAVYEATLTYELG